MKIIKRIKKLILIGNKTCCVCKHFVPFYVNMGMCGAVDYRLCDATKNSMSKCDCGCFRKKTLKLPIKL